MVNIQKDFVEESVWLEAWVAYTSSSNSTSKEGATNWANSCLENYRKNFKIAPSVAQAV